MKKKREERRKIILYKEKNIYKNILIIIISINQIKLKILFEWNKNSNLIVKFTTKYYYKFQNNKINE